MRELDFEKLREEKIKFLEGHHTIILATSHDNKVTVRTVTYATEGLDFYFMSWNHHDACMQKSQQLRKNRTLRKGRRE